MRNHNAVWRWCVLTSVLFLGLLPMAFAADQALEFTADQFEAKRNAVVEWKDGVLTLKIHDPEWSGGVQINPPAGEKFDFSKARYFACDIQNMSKSDQMRLTMHLTSGSRESNSSSHVDLRHSEVNTGVGLNPGEKRTLRIYLPHAALFRAPGTAKNYRVIDTQNVNFIQFQLLWPYEAPRKYLVDCQISNFRLEGEADVGRKVVDKADYLPFIDRYGQYVHNDWPEKIKSDADLVAAREREDKELAANPRPASWNKFGGWANGPQLEATGNFRTEKVDGKWYLVDPEGRLFWSIGLDVMKADVDATQRREENDAWFTADTPKEKTLPFNAMNLRKKYGEGWQDKFYATLERRMDAWGLNTIANWADRELYARGERPYTLSLVEFVRGAPRLRFHDGNRVRDAKFYDVYAPEFAEKMGNLLRDQAEALPFIKKSIDGPMCIGYFVDNELNFGEVIGATVRAPAEQPAKQELVKQLKAKYKEKIAGLNQAWETDFADWDALAANIKQIKRNKAYDADTSAFYRGFVNRYFETCRAGIKSVAPHRLYLGCRFVGFRQAGVIWEAAAKNCDVITVNSYGYSLFNVIRSDFRDKPVMVGEFHFGTRDRGMFMPGLAPVNDQAERAVAFKRYVQGMLVNPNFVGAHWFQLRDQPLTGRWDGEGYQIGFIDVADTPYPEICAAARQIGETMYEYRKNGKLVD